MNGYLLVRQSVTQKAHAHTLPPAFPLAPPRLRLYSRARHPRAAATRCAAPLHLATAFGQRHYIRMTSFGAELRSTDRFGPNVGSHITHTNVSHVTLPLVNPLRARAEQTT